MKTIITMDAIQGDTFFSAHSNHERKNWRKRDNNPLPTYPQSMNMGNMGMNMGMGPGVGMGLGNYYYPGSLNPMAPMTPMAPVPPMAPMPFPGPAHPTTATAAAAANVHGNNAVMGPPKTVDPPRGYIDPYYLRQSRPPRPASTSPIPQEDVPRIANWADDVAKHYLLEETSVNESTLAARVDQLADEEKRLFLDEYRFPGMQTVCILTSCLPTSASPMGHRLTIHCHSYTDINAC